jgi:ATP-dependent DNA ligase
VFTKCQLADSYRRAKNYSLEKWWSSPKIDGVRGIYTDKLLSITLKQNYVGLKHIEEVCQEIASMRYVIDGELFIKNERFDVISGIIRERKNYDINQKLRVQFHVFALWKNALWLNTEEMLTEISNLIPSNQSAVVAVPYSIVLNNPVAIFAQNQFNFESGASNEGTMLRNTEIAYHQGRSQHLIKVKNFTKGQFIVKGFSKGTGKYANSLGKLVVERNGIRSSVGTGFTDAERREIWLNQNSYLGSLTEVIHMGTTPNNSLRFPVFSRFVN